MFVPYQKDAIQLNPTANQLLAVNKTSIALYFVYWNGFFFFHY